LFYFVWILANPQVLCHRSRLHPVSSWFLAQRPLFPPSRNCPFLTWKDTAFYHTIWHTSIRSGSIQISAIANRLAGRRPTASPTFTSPSLPTTHPKPSTLLVAEQAGRTPMNDLQWRLDTVVTHTKRRIEGRFWRRSSRKPANRPACARS